MPSANPTLSVPSSSAATTPLTPALQTTIYGALLSHHSIPAIQSALAHELQASGWTSALRAHILTLLRTGECTTYDEVMRRVLDATRVVPPEDGRHANGDTDGNAAEEEGNNEDGDANERRNGDASTGNGNGATTTTAAVTAADGEESVKVPERAIREGIRVVKRELERCLDIEVEGE